MPPLGHMESSPSGVTALNALVYPVVGGPLVEVRAGTGRHGTLRYLRMRHDV